jgi:L-lactate dehydrogenase complex protein LldG
MDDRQKILKKLDKRKPVPEDIPSLSSRQYTEEQLTGLFIENLSRGGGVGEYINKNDLDTILQKMYKGSDRILDLSDYTEIHSQSINLNSGRKIDHIDLLILDGIMGVAENGAVWITGKQLSERRFPFITGQVVMILPRRTLVYDLLQAYQQIDLSGDGFGIWIAGPSKTADIEQSLVIGAQGASRHRVLLID